MKSTAIAGFALFTAMAAGSQTNARSEFIAGLANQPVDVTLIPTLLDALSAKDESVRLAALQVWGKLGSQYDATYIGDLYDNDDEPTKESSRKRIVEFRKELISKIKPRISDHTLARKESIRTLCFLGGSVQSICPPELMCGNGSEETLGWMSEKALSEIAKRNSSEIESLINDDNPNIVLNAINALGSDFAKTHPEIPKLLLNRQSKNFRAIGAYLIGQYWPESSIKVLSPMLDDPDEDLRKCADFSISIPRKDALKWAEAFPGRSKSIRTKAIEYLAGTTDPKEILYLKYLLRDPVPEVRAAAISTLYFNDEKKVDKAIVLSMLNDSSPVVFRAALMSGASCNMTELLPYLKVALLSPDRKTRDAAIWSCMRTPNGKELSSEQVTCVELGVSESWMASPDFGNPRFAGLIDRCLNSKSADAREILAFYLTSSVEIVKQPATLNILIRLARDESDLVSRHVLATLAQSKDPRAFSVLVELSTSTDQAKRLSVASMIGASQSREAIPILEKLMNDKDKAVSVTAKATLKQLMKDIGGNG